MTILKHFIQATALAALFAGSAEAASVKLSPLTLEVDAPSSATKLSLENDGDESVTAQVRVFKWQQVNGKDELVATRDVVASPPALKIEPGKKSIIRVVRVSKAPVAAEESYRLLIDEVPKKDTNGAGVKIAIQYSVPLFISAQRGTQQLNWTARMSKGILVMEAANQGTRRAKLSDMSVGLPGGKSIRIAEGLAGYVLADSQKKWAAKSKAVAPGATITVTAQSELGPVNGTATVQGQ